ncbi:hypothetical protein N7501_005859 [Penicillium viridicatum]|nr:hypothetical protein N7501_005859 [Penicillium viridicatum]
MTLNLTSTLMPYTASCGKRTVLRIRSNLHLFRGIKAALMKAG